MDAIELQHKKGQDMVRTGQNWMVVCDGHGKGNVIEHLRSLPWDTLVLESNPIETINHSISTLGDTYFDGATFSMVRINDDGIECTWIGDSQIRVYANGEQVWCSTNHDKSNQSEIDRILQEGGNICDSWAINVIDNDTITMKKSKYFNFDDREKLAVSRSLGHNKRFMPKAERHVIPFIDTTWKVLIATDGLWDMTCKEDDDFLGNNDTGASDIAHMANTRWNKPWTYKHPEPATTCSYRERIANNKDDIGVAVWRSDIIDSLGT